jgi:myosin-1
VPGIDDVADYKEVQDSLAIVGCSDAERDEVTRVIAATLWLGNIAFTEDRSEKSAISDPNGMTMPPPGC